MSLWKMLLGDEESVRLLFRESDQMWYSVSVTKLHNPSYLNGLIDPCRSEEGTFGMEYEDQKSLEPLSQAKSSKEEREPEVPSRRCSSSMTYRELEKNLPFLRWFDLYEESK